MQILATITSNDFFQINLGQLCLGAVFLVGWGITWQKSKSRGEANTKLIEKLTTKFETIDKEGPTGTAQHFLILTSSIAALERRIITLEAIAPSIAKMETSLDWMTWMMRKRWGIDAIPEPHKK